MANEIDKLGDVIGLNRGFIQRSSGLIAQMQPAAINFIDQAHVSAATQSY